MRLGPESGSVKIASTASRTEHSALSSLEFTALLPKRALRLRLRHLMYYKVVVVIHPITEDEMNNAAANRMEETPGPNARAPEPPELDLRAQIGLWLRVIDALLSAIEDTALSLRKLGGNAREALLGMRALFAQVGREGDALGDELASWRARMGRLTSAGLTLGWIAGAYRLHTTKAVFLSRRRAAAALAELHEDCAERLYQLSVRQGGAFLKVGQMLAARPDLLPDAYVRALARLQDAAPEVPFATIRTMIESELGRPCAELFAELDQQPLAA